MNRKYTDRSRIVTHQRCDRRRFLEYEEGPRGMGIQPSRTALPLLVGGAVHAGLAELLSGTQSMINASPIGAFDWMADGARIEEAAVAAALAEFNRSATAIELDHSEQQAMQPTQAAQAFNEQVIAQARELGMPLDGLGEGVAREQALSEFDRYLRAEQQALVEGLVRAYSRRRLQPLLEQFEVLEVEREGSWKLSEWQRTNDPVDVLTNDRGLIPYKENVELWFMSRPDALLRERQSNELYLLSYKTTGAWDTRKARDIEHDMQGLSEGVEVERRLGEWWHIVRDHEQRFKDTRKPTTTYHDSELTDAIWKYLSALSAPPRIHAIRYEFLLKGYRDEDRELTARLGMTVYSQRSHLVRQYVATSTPKKGDAGYKVGDVAWSWDFYRPEDDKDSKLAWQNWQGRPAFEQDGGVRAWIDALDQSEILMSGEDSTVGLEPRVLGWKSPAQAMGVTREHPLDSVFVPPVTVWRSDDELRDWVEEVEHQEREAAVHADEVRAATDPGERRHLLNIYFPKIRSACQWPSLCPFARERVGICWGGAEIQNDPIGVGAGEYKERTPNHPIEAQPIDAEK